MRKLQVFIVLGFAIMFAAGWTFGRMFPLGTNSASSNLHGDDQFPNFRAQLGLTSEQDQKMKQIWQDARAQAEPLFHQFRQIDHERDDQVQSMLDARQLIAYGDIVHDRDDRIASLKKQISQNFDQARNATRQLLTPDQQARFDVMEKTHRHEPPFGGPSFGHRHSHSQPATAPAE